MLRRWKILKEDNEYVTPIFSLLKKRVSSPDESREGDFYTLHTGHWVNVIAKTSDGKIVLVSQYRHGIDEISLEIPGGCIDNNGESALEAAKRELLEETGYHSENWIYLGKASANPAIMNNYCHVFLAENCAFKSPANPDYFEELEISLISENDFFDAVSSGKVHHALSVAAAGLWLISKK